MDDNAIKLTCSVLNIVEDTEDLNNYTYDISKIIKSHMSNMSVGNARNYVLISNISSVISNIYLKRIDEGVNDLVGFNVDSDVMNGVIKHIDSCIIYITHTILNLEGRSVVSRGQLNAYAPSTDDSDAMLRKSENTDAEILLYFANKDLLSKNKDVLEDFSDFKKAIEDDVDSHTETFVSRAGMILEKVAEVTSLDISYYDSLKKLIDSLDYAKEVYSYLSASERKDVMPFISRPFADIKKDFEKIFPLN